MLTDDGAAGPVNRDESVKNAANGDHSNGTDAATGSSGKGTSGASAVAENVSFVPRRSKIEKKTRKILAKLELKPVC